VVFYRMLTGDVPFKADTAVSTGIKHLQEPVPKLPSHLADFQDVMDRALAKKPEMRFQSGADFAEALDALPARPDLTQATIRSEVVTTQEIRAVGGQFFTSRDPTRTERTSRRRRQRRMLRTVGSVALLAAVVGGASVFLIEQPHLVTRLSAAVGIIDDPMVQEAWNSARSLRQDPNQSLATVVAGYRRVLNLDPVHQGAESALAGLATQWKDDVQAALDAGNLTQAETKLDESMLAFPDDPSLQDLSRLLTNRKHAERLLTSTQGLLRSHGLSDIPSATAAIQAYQEVLRLAPGHPVAIQELDALSQHYATLAAEAADTANVDQAIAFLDRASAANDRLPQLAGVREKIQQATTLQTAISEMLQQASRYRAEGALINPPGENAAELYHRVLATAPDNAIAAQGINGVVSQLLSTATELLSQGDLDSVRALVDRASAVGLDQESVNRLRSRLDGEVARLAKVREDLEKAEGLLQRGFITEPPNGNAVALLRDVERLDPGNQRARELLARSATRLAEAARDAYDAGLKDDATHYLELALTVTPNVAEWRELRNQWEQGDATL
jgi:tetratricopeptide (TPR) repeat protein